MSGQQQGAVRADVTAKNAFVIAGDSHIASYGVPIKSERDDYYLMKIKTHHDDTFGVVGAWPRRFEEYWDATLKYADGNHLVVTWGGNTHLASFLFLPSPPFDFISSSTPELPLMPNVEIVPEEVLRTILSAPIKSLEEQVKRLKSVAKNVFVPGTPPPKSDDEFIRQQIRTEPHFMRLANQLGLDPDSVPLSPPTFRLKLWAVLQDLLRDTARRTGAIFVPVPVGAVSRDGFLDRSCYARDVTHANQKFGALMMTELHNKAGISKT